MVWEAIRGKPKQINTRLGTFGEVAYALLPKARRTPTSTPRRSRSRSRI